MTFEPELPKEVRGDQFETATPVQIEEGHETVKDEVESATPFDYDVIEFHTEMIPTDYVVSHPTDVYPDGAIDTYVEPDIVPEIVTEVVATQEAEDQTIDNTTTTTTTTTHTSTVSLAAPITFPGLDSSVVADTTGLSTYEDMEGSGRGGTDDASPEGSGSGIIPTPGAGIVFDVMTDETEIGATEVTTLIPDTTTTAAIKIQTEEFEGSASGEDEASGQDGYPPETPRFTSTLSPFFSTLQPQHPQSTMDVDTPEGISTTEPMAREVEASGVHFESGDVVTTHLPASTAGQPIKYSTTLMTPDTSKQEHTTYPSLAAAHGQTYFTFTTKLITTLSDDQTTLTTERITLEPDMPKQTSVPSLASKDDITHSTVITTPYKEMTHKTIIYKAQNEQSTTSTAAEVTTKTLSSTTPPLYTFDQGTYSVPEWALVPDSNATPLPDDLGDYDKEIAPPLVKAQPKIPGETPATEEPEAVTDSAYSVEASTVNVRGTIMFCTLKLCFMRSSLSHTHWFDFKGFPLFELSVVDLLPCSVSVCLNGGSCYKKGAENICNCAPGYTGQHCETGTNTCYVVF